MGFVFTPGVVGTNNLRSALNNDIPLAGTPVEGPGNWVSIYAKEDTNSFTFNTRSGQEFTSFKFSVLKGKFTFNGLGTLDSEYVYLVLEEDTVNDRIIVRTADSFTAGGVNSGVTDFNDCLTTGSFLEGIAGAGACAVGLGDNSVFISSIDAGAVTSVFLAAFTPGFSPAAGDLQSLSVLGGVDSSKGVIRSGFSFEGGVFDLGYLGDETLTNDQDGPNREVLSPVLLGDNSSFLGFLTDVFRATGQNPVDFDMINDEATNDGFRVFCYSGGYFAAKEKV
jgi:hypothetical protein